MNLGEAAKILADWYTRGTNAASAYPSPQWFWLADQQVLLFKKADLNLFDEHMELCFDHEDYPEAPQSWTQVENEDAVCVIILNDGLYGVTYPFIKALELPHDDGTCRATVESKEQKTLAQFLDKICPPAPTTSPPKPKTYRSIDDPLPE